MASMSPKGRAQRSCFPACFKFSCGSDRRRKNTTEENGPEFTLKTPDVEGRKGNEKKTWLNWCRFRHRKSGRKTAPVDSEIVEQIQGNAPHEEEGKVEKVISPAIEKTQGSSGTNTNISAEGLPAPTAEVPQADEGKEAKFQEPRTPKISNEEIQQVTETHQVVVCQVPPAPRHKVDAEKSTQPSADKKNFLKQAPDPAVLCNPAVKKRAKTPIPRPRSLIWAMIFLMTLAALLLCGRLCAVFCTSASLYMVPRLIKPQ